MGLTSAAAQEQGMGSVLRRLVLYLVWGAGFFLLLELLFTRPAAGTGALLLASAGLVKDAADRFLVTGDPALYGYVEHNPLNILLVAGIVSGRYTIGGALEAAVLVVALVDLVVDGLQDVQVELAG